METVPTSELTSKLMRYLCKGVLGDNKETSKKEDNSLKNGLKNCNFASEQITHFVNASVRVAEAEARAANASTAAIRRAGEAAVEFIKTAVCEVGICFRLFLNAPSHGHIINVCVFSPNSGVQKDKR